MICRVDWKAAAGLVSGLGLMCAAVPYLIAIGRGSARPSIVSWGGIGVISAISFSAQMLAEPSWSAAVAATSCIYCPLIVVAAWRTGTRHLTRLDVTCLVVGSAAIVLWQATGTPALGVGVSALADLALCVPMIHRVAVDPSTEPVAPFLIAAVAAAFGIVAARRYDAVSLIWPVYIWMLNGVIALLAARTPSGRTSSVEPVASVGPTL
jgi:hypothetical protein